MLSQRTSPRAWTAARGDQGHDVRLRLHETSRSCRCIPRYRSVERHAARAEQEIPFLRPDAKSQVTVEYNSDGSPHRIHTVVFSTQHDDTVMCTKNGKPYFADDARKVLIEKLILPTFKAERPDLLKGPIQIVVPGTAPRDLDDAIGAHINPTGCFLEGGPHGDCGLTGRKIIVDTYGGRGRHGGGAFSGKDPTKVDRSAAYVARYIAKNIVAAGLAAQCEVQLSYAIGYPDPLNVWVSTFGSTTGGLNDEQIIDLIRTHFKLTPRGIIESLNLRPADLPRDGTPRPLRSLPARLHLGSHRQGRGPARTVGQPALV
jgi:S-adenosylmethionine synthetase